MSAHPSPFLWGRPAVKAGRGDAFRLAVHWGRLWCLTFVVQSGLAAAGLLNKFDSIYEVDYSLTDRGILVHRLPVQRLRREATTSTENETVTDDHMYYTANYYRGRPGESVLWLDLDDEAISGRVQFPPNLATSARKGTTVPLQFAFPYYGHSVDSVIITNGGFIYAGTYVHRHLAATQYIAPLMGNFSPSPSQPSGVRFYDDGSSLTVEWKGQHLVDNVEAGPFTFQTTIFQDGRIVFAYQEVPIPVSRISDAGHPVKIGLADAYYIDKMIGLFTKKREIYEYHKVEVDQSEVTSGTLVLLTPLPTCNQLTSCTTCISSPVEFNCTWCSALQTCSDGFDRHRQSWQDSGCTENHIEILGECPDYTPMTITTGAPPTAKPQPTVSRPAEVKGQSTEAQEVGTTKPINPKTPASTVDYCKGISCLNGGECEEGFCNCPANYDGSRCQKYATFHCQKAICRNGGTCREGITSHVCDCLVGYSGAFCEVDLDLPVKSQPSTTKGLTVGAIVSISLISLLIFGLFVWAVYAYRHPTSTSGLFVLEAKHRLKGRGRGSNGVKYKYHQQMDNNHVDIQL